MLHPVVKHSLENSMSYETYSELVNRLVEIKGTTGSDSSEALVEYTKLNQRRMKRWDKTTKVSEATKAMISSLPHKMTWLLITESWCGDAAHVVPVINKLAALNDNIKLHIVLRDEHPELMDMFLTNGARAIPKLLIIDDETGDVLSTFGPRPSEATQMVKAYKGAHGKLTAEFKEELQVWYNKNKGQNIIEDIAKELCKFEPSMCL
ncbi:thioredoxin family protein [Tamlana fucoidanivorans]|uniref:Thioredoxin family protein n=1 Tax=Allotamlana fucoidanivorans TaxID=2583814 RepID=A0A5C4SK69_9FLAO|nr:thioredoxin family protein [Tamlana fucoidanivorans]TNJ44209.1 thioredoxin family protein [Tamlana fucoidanivorans]